MEDVKEVQESTEQKPVEVVTETVQPGEKTDSALLLKSLQEERDKRRDLEAEVEKLKTQPQSDVFSDEGKLLKKEIDDLKLADARREEQAQLSSLQTQFPAIKDKQAEFDEYRQQNPGMHLTTAAKAFLVERDLFEAPSRKGLEKQSGGGRQAPKDGYSADDIADLRNNNFRQYKKLLQEGKIKVD